MTNNCPICKSQNLTVLFNQEEVPVFQNKVYPSQDIALRAPTGKVTLTQCNDCSFVFNSSFDNNLMIYDTNYHNEQGYSNYFKDHLNNVLTKLMSLGLGGKKVVEIGCGKGYFLELLLSQGIECTGFDPTYEGTNPNVIKDYFSDKYSNLEADVILLRHTLEHIPNVHEFIVQIAEANNNKGHIFIEVPTFDWIYKKQSFWDIFYEHCNYFTPQSLSGVFTEFETGSIFNGQYMYIWGNLATVKSRVDLKPIKPFDKLSFEKTLNDFRILLKKSEGRLAIWGAAAKGSTFLNILDPKREYVKYVIDINPAKQNRFIARTGHPIYSPDRLKFDPVDRILVMNENYYSEIKRIVNNSEITLESI